MTDLEKLIDGMPVGWDTGFSDDDRLAILDGVLCESVPFDYSAVYLLLRNKTVVYVGQSNNVLHRIGQHALERIKEFDAYTIILTPPDKRIMRERQLIRTFSPYYNITSIREQGYRSAKHIAELFGVTEWTVKEIIHKHKIPWAHNTGAHCYTVPERVQPFIAGAKIKSKKVSEIVATKLF